METWVHRSVMLNEVLEALQVRPGGEYADVTFGEGGHSEAMIQRGAALVLGCDRDTQALDLYKQQGALRDDRRLELKHSRISEFGQSAGTRKFDGILADLGISTRQVLEAERGFSFSHAGPLDMRMDTERDVPLIDWLGSVREQELADGLYRVAGMHNSRSLASRIIKAVRANAIKTTEDLAKLAGPKQGKAHPATVLFLALRTLVNEEDTEVKKGLPLLIEALKPGGRIAVISFHSDEDRVVKHALSRLAGKCVCEGPICTCPRIPLVKLVFKKPLVPTSQETRANPRSRSAKLRCAERL